MKVAIVHYWLVNMRGGEKMLEALLELYPEADIYTHVYDRASVSPAINAHKVYTTFIQKLPFASRLYQAYMPLMPGALKDLDLRAYDLVISSEAGPAKGVVVSPDAYHLCYCHSPMRYLWDMYHDYFRGAGFISRFFMKHLTDALRVWDITSSNLVDRFVTNSSYVASRIRRYYRREAAVVYGPVDVGFYLSRPRSPAAGDDAFYLFLGQLTGYKRADLAIEACIQTGRRLVVAGGGGNEKSRRPYRDAVKSGLLTFTGRLTDAAVADYYSRARALIFPGIEDLGLVPIEANAAGCPVIAYGKGGVLDTVSEGVTGLFFPEQSVESLIAALDRFEKVEDSFKNRAPFTSHAALFSKEEFKKRITDILDKGLKL